MISPENVRSLFDYDKNTGVLIWRETGERAGSVQSNGYRVVRHKKKAYQEHRIIWLYVSGDWPPHYVDHVNRDKTDNRLSNLRMATHQQNCWNAKTRKKNGGLPGTAKNYNRWNAKITINGVRKFLGCFDTEQEAHEAYILASKELCGDFTPFV